MFVSGVCQQTAFVGNTDAYERAHLAEECHAARQNGDPAPKELVEKARLEIKGEEMTWSPASFRVRPEAIGGHGQRLAIGRESGTGVGEAIVQEK
jgi:hypothetical protein